LRFTPSAGAIVTSGAGAAGAGGGGAGGGELGEEKHIG